MLICYLGLQANNRLSSVRDTSETRNRNCNGEDSQSIIFALLQCALSGSAFKLNQLTSDRGYSLKSIETLQDPVAQR